MNEFFIPELNLFLSECGLKANEIDEFIVITGPGSFTGVRIGIAALTGLSLALTKRLRGISALDAAAILSGKREVQVSAKLKFDEYVTKSYDFDNKNFSELSVVAKNNIPESILINSGSEDTPGYENLTTVATHPYNALFLTNPVPEYVRASEAELNFDKKSF